MRKLQIGAKYKHYKGGKYIVIGSAKHSETLEELVIYRRFNDKKLWARPKKMFLENVTINGITKPRFAEIKEDSTTN